MTDPTNVFAMDDIKFMTGFNVEPVSPRNRPSATPSRAFMAGRQRIKKKSAT